MIIEIIIEYQELRKRIKNRVFLVLLFQADYFVRNSLSLFLM